MLGRHSALALFIAIQLLAPPTISLLFNDPIISYRRSQSTTDRLLLESLPLFCNPWMKWPRERRPRRLWSTRAVQTKGTKRKKRVMKEKRCGLWEASVMKRWVRTGRAYPDLENQEYVEAFRMSKAFFWNFVETYKSGFEPRGRKFPRVPIPPEKCVGMLVYWLAHGGSFKKIARDFDVSLAFVHKIMHKGIKYLRRKLVPRAIRFPEGMELVQVMEDFAAHAGLPCVAGAMDGTFFHVLKPILNGDSYYCYKGFHAITCLAVVDARGVFTYICSGTAGSMGDAGTFALSGLHTRIRDGVWLNASPVPHVNEHGQVDYYPVTRVVEGATIEPYLVADSAFALSSKVIKCYAESRVTTTAQDDFNYCVIRTRRVVENAFGRLKGRWHVCVKNHIYNPMFASDVCQVVCALHNAVETGACGWREEWQAVIEAFELEQSTGGGQPPRAAAAHQSPTVTRMLEALTTHCSKYVDRVVRRQQPV